jgi:signal transduction histidine kinase
MFVVIVTAVLAISGTYSQHKLSNQLEIRNRQLRQSVLTRLRISLPAALWNLDKAKVDSLLEAEMLPDEVLAIRVYDTNATNLFSGKMRDSADQIVNVNSDLPIGGTAVEAPLVFRDFDHSTRDTEKPATLGHVVVNFSRAQIDAALSAELARKVLEILLLDLILVLALSFSLRMVFVPLTHLRDSLFELATRETDEVEELPEDRRDEFGEVASGFNRIQRKLKSIIAQTKQAEEEARNASEETARTLQELRQTQDSLIQAERMASLGGLVAGVAHEINTPVGITLTSASVLLEATERILPAMDAGNVRKSDILNYLATAGDSSRLIMTNAFRAAELIQSFKQIAVDQTNEMGRAFKVKDYIDEIIMSLHPKLRQTHIEVQVNCAEDITLDSYPGAFAQVLTNLVLNALTHAYEADSIGCVRIDVAPSDGMLELNFRDDGKGIPPEHLDKIFDPFFTTRRGTGGTGLGLNIVYNLIVNQLGGAISVESTWGQGTHFTIRLPFALPTQETA